MIIPAAKYLVVGVLGTLTHLGLLYVTVEFLHFTPLLGSSTAFIWVVLQSYGLNRTWTFQSKKKHAITLPRYIVVSVAGFLTNLLVMFVMINVLEVWYIIAQMVTILVIPAMNFLMNKYWTFS
jgi:putative flippase GtrA